MIFEKRQAMNQERGIRTKYVYIMFDGMQMKWSVKWSTQTGNMIGLKNDSQDLKTVLHRLFVTWSWPGRAGKESEPVVNHK